VKIVELMGVSEKSFSDAVRQAVKEASKTIRNITGVEVIKSTAQVEGDEILEYHVTVRLAFAIERGKSAATAGESEQDEEEDERGAGDEEEDERGAADEEEEEEEDVRDADEEEEEDAGQER
jgi:flavin-binding protein dodecin